jgi:hypothetical protein
MLQQKNFNSDNSSCVLCHENTLETLEHLFFGCDFSHIFWWSLNIEWDLDLNLIEMMLDCRQRFNLKCHKEMIIIGCWALWNSRNKLIFEDVFPDQHTCMIFFKETFQMVMHRAKPSLKEVMQQWFDTL